MKLKTTLLIFSFVLTHTLLSQNQSQLAPTPPMGFMTWNYFGLDIHENDIKTLADAWWKPD